MKKGRCIRSGLFCWELGVGNSEEGVIRRTLGGRCGGLGQ